MVTKKQSQSYNKKLKTANGFSVFIIRLRFVKKNNKVNILTLPGPGCEVFHAD